MKRCYIGLSTPIGFYQGYLLEPNRPNAILEAPMGLFLLYDEIWFLNRKLCPYNMEDLNYVHFLNEEYDLKFIDNEFWSEIEKMSLDIKLPNEIMHSELVSSQSVVTRHVKSYSKPFWITNKIEKKAYCKSTVNHLFDKIVADKFDLELIANSFFTELRKRIEPIQKIQLTQKLIIPEFPNFQGVDGPYIEVVDDFRSERLIKQFRNKISEITNDDLISIDNLMKNLENEMVTAGKNLIRKQTSPISLYRGIALKLISLIPFLSNIVTAYGFINNVYKLNKDRNNMGWMSFTVKSQIMINDYYRKATPNKRHR